MTDTNEELIKSFIKKRKKRFPRMSEEQLEKELIPLKPEEHLQPRIGKKKKTEIKT